MMRRNMTLIIPAVSIQEAEEKPKKYWKGYEKENVRQRIIPIIIGQEMQLDNFLEISIPNNSYLDASWINKYQMCVKYFRENGNLLISARYVIDGVRFGQWIRWQRQNYKKGMITPTKKELLKKIGMIWYAQSGKSKKEDKKESVPEHPSEDQKKQVISHNYPKTLRGLFLQEENRPQRDGPHLLPSGVRFIFSFCVA